MRQAVFLRVRVRTEDLPRLVLVESQTVVSSRPYAIAIHQDAIDVVVGKTIGASEVIPLKHRHVLRGGLANADGHNGQQDPATQRRNSGTLPCLASLDLTADGGCPDMFRFRLHNVLRYSMRSFNSSLVRSLVTP